MKELLNNIGNIITNLINWLGTITSYLITNPIFIIIIAIGIFVTIFNLLKNIINNIKWKNKYSKNAREMEEEEWNDRIDMEDF